MTREEMVRERDALRAEVARLILRRRTTSGRFERDRLESALETKRRRIDELDHALLSAL